MKKLWKKLVAVTTAVMMAVTLLPAMANAESTFTQTTGKFRIHKTDESGENGLKGAEFLYYKVYDINSTTGEITINSKFAGVDDQLKTRLNVMIDDTKNYTKDQELALANDLKSYIAQNNIQPEKKDSGEDDVLTSGNDGHTNYAAATNFGYYLIVETKAPDKQRDKTYITGDPFFLALPSTGENGTWVYDVTSKPKANKNGISGPEKKIVTTNDGKEVTVDKKDVNVGDIVKYRIKVQIPRFTDKSFEVTNNMPKLTITDTMDRNLIILNNDTYPIKITVNGRPVSKEVNIATNRGTENTYTAFTTVLQANNDFTANDCGEYVTITYFAQVDKVDANVFTNTAYVKVNDDSELPGETPELYTYGIQLTKTLDTKKLTGDQKVYFDLYKKVNNSYEKVSDLTNVISKNKTPEADQSKGQFVTDENGQILIKGLSLGDYALRETTTVSGYTLLSKDIEFNLTDTEPDGALDNNQNTERNILAKTVDNKKGFSMPSTGGMGTYIFTIAGLVIMAGAAFLLIASKKRRA